MLSSEIAKLSADLKKPHSSEQQDTMQERFDHIVSAYRCSIGVTTGSKNYHKHYQV